MITGQLRAMRDVFIETLYTKMGTNDQLFFLSADFGSPALDRLRRDFKDRFINVGIAEQNLINVATGLAIEGYTVYAYGIAPFITMRAYEQIRVNLSISSEVKPINVNIIGVGGGVSYDVSGPTHHCLEDISIMRLLPNLVVFSPSDWKLAEAFVDYSIHVTYPKYIRFDGKPLPPIYKNIGDLDFDKGFHELVRGERVCLVSTGYMTHRALNVAKRHQNIGVVDLFLLKPVNEELLYEAIQEYGLIITLEEAFINRGGLDSIISKLLRDTGSNIKMKNLGFDDKYVFDQGDREYLHRINNLDEEAIIRAVGECKP